jgi:Zn-finger nucleic acid-binding protein
MKKPFDYRPQCRGVWLDRGELDKIIERSAAASPQPSFLPPQPKAAPPPHHSQPNYERQELHNPRYEEKHDPRHKKRKSSFLGELFDFGD